MSIRKRVWKTSQGEERQAWILDFFDGSGKRRHETFARRKDAEQREAQVRIDVSRGARIPARDKTIAQIADDWLDHLREDRREQSTICRSMSLLSWIIWRSGDVARTASIRSRPQWAWSPSSVRRIQ